MRMLLGLLFLLACFCIVGRIDYEASLATGEPRSECAKEFAPQQEGQR